MKQISEARVRILDDKYHQQIQKQFPKDNMEQVRSVVTFLHPSPKLISAIEKGLKDQKYSEIGTLNDSNFVELVPESFEFNFDTYYAREKKGYQDSDKTNQPREFKRIHQGIYDLVRSIGEDVQSRNNTMLTTLMLRYGASKLYELVPKEDFDLISRYYNSCSTSAFKHDNYFEGFISKMLLTKPLNKYENSRTVILDVTCKQRAIHFYPDEFVFQILDQLSILGFSGPKAKFAIELLLLLAIEDYQDLDEYNIKREIMRLIAPTVKAIKALSISNLVHQDINLIFEPYKEGY